MVCSISRITIKLAFTLYKRIMRRKIGSMARRQRMWLPFLIGFILPNARLRKGSLFLVVLTLLQVTNSPVSSCSNSFNLGETINHSGRWSEVSFVERHPQKSKFIVILHGVYGSSASLAARAILADCGELQESTGVH